MFPALVNAQPHSLSIINTYEPTSCPQNWYVLLNVAVVGKQLVYSRPQWWSFPLPQLRRGIFILFIPAVLWIHNYTSLMCHLHNYKEWGHRSQWGYALPWRNKDTTQRCRDIWPSPRLGLWVEWLLMNLQFQNKNPLTSAEAPQSQRSLINKWN